LWIALCYLEYIHTSTSGGTIPLASVVNPPVSSISKTMRVTAYCSCSKCCGKYADGVTASGHKIKPGDKFCAAPKSIPFGTLLIVPGYNNGKPVKVLDRGGAIKGNKLDVFFDDAKGKTGHQRALEWGVRNVVVTTIKIGSKP
jgi:3D (Asp-Asp-Asp) domain-containing protein